MVRQQGHTLYPISVCCGTDFEKLNTFDKLNTDAICSLCSKNLGTPPLTLYIQLIDAKGIPTSPMLVALAIAEWCGFTPSDVEVRIRL